MPLHCKQRPLCILMLDGLDDAIVGLSNRPQPRGESADGLVVD